MSEQPIDKPSALELARLAALLDPALAKARPQEAVRIASKLIASAQKHIDRTGVFERFARNLKPALQAHAEMWNSEPVMSIADAYERFGRERYKTLDGFTTALQKENLTVRRIDGEEVTAERAVRELLRRLAARKRQGDRKRKAKKSKNLRRTGSRKSGTLPAKSGN